MENENTSGHGSYAVVPYEIKKWNWGAFWLTWIWGIFNKSYIALLMFLPVVNIIVPFYLGAKGNELAWRNKQWYNVDEFKDCQRRWSIAGWIFIAIAIMLMFIQVRNEYNDAKRTQEITNQVIEILEQNDEAKELIGKNYKVLSNHSVDYIANYMMLLQGNEDIVCVYVFLNENNEIDKIEVSTFDDNKKMKDDEQVKIVIKVN